MFIFFFSWLLYLRFFIVWLLVITMDFLLEFRFEFLWPFWLLIRSIYDSLRYQGLVSYILNMYMHLFNVLGLMFKSYTIFIRICGFNFSLPVSNF